MKSRFGISEYVFLFSLLLNSTDIFNTFCILKHQTKRRCHSALTALRKSGSTCRIAAKVPKLSHVSVAALTCLQRPFGIHKTFAQGPYSVQCALAASQKQIKYRALTARKLRAYGILIALIAFKYYLLICLHCV